MLKRKVSFTFKRKNILEIKERIYPLSLRSNAPGHPLLRIESDFETTRLLANLP